MELFYINKMYMFFFLSIETITENKFDLETTNCRRHEDFRD